MSEPRAYIKLSTLKRGDQGILKSFTSDDIQLRMLDMGCLPESTFTLEHIAPLGDPISLRLTHTSVSVRRSDADYIWVEKIPSAAVAAQDTP